MPATSSASSLDARVGFIARRLDRIENRSAPIDRPAGLCARLAACELLGISGGGWRAAAPRHFPHDTLLTKAASGPAVTGSPAWAGDLVGPLVQDLGERLLPETVFQQLRMLSGLEYELGQGGVPRVPSHMPSAQGGFVSEGDPIPVVQMILTSLSLPPLKAASIVGVTKELIKGSPLNVEQTLRALLAEDLRLFIDSILLGDADATAAQPAGLLSDATVVAPGASLAEDIAALLGAIAPAYRPVLIASAGTAGSVSVLAPGLAVPVIASPLLVAGALVAVDAAAFASAISAPNFSVSESAEVNFQSTPAAISAPGPTLAAPTFSLWQQASVGIRLIFDFNWVLRRPDAVAVLSDPAWMLSARSAAASQAETNATERGALARASAPPRRTPA